MFELNGSYSDVQKTKTKTANRSLFWLPKIGTLVETIEERCRLGGLFVFFVFFCLFRLFRLSVFLSLIYH